MIPPLPPAAVILLEHCPESASIPPSNQTTAITQGCARHSPHASTRLSIVALTYAFAAAPAHSVRSQLKPQSGTNQRNTGITLSVKHRLASFARSGVVAGEGPEMTNRSTPSPTSARRRSIQCSAGPITANRSRSLQAPAWTVATLPGSAHAAHKHRAPAHIPRDHSLKPAQLLCRTLP